jgi:hypothetical protein
MRLKALALGILVAFAAAMSLTACSLVDDSDSGDAGDAKVIGVALSTQVNAQGQPVNPRNFFSPTDNEIRATVALQGVKAGQTVEGRWYQLGTADAGPDGQEVSTSDFKLESDSIQENTAVVSFFLRSPQGFPEDSWVMRVFVDGEQLRTAGFIITRAAQTGQGTSPAPSTSPTAAPTATRTP